MLVEDARDLVVQLLVDSDALHHLTQGLQEGAEERAV